MWACAIMSPSFSTTLPFGPINVTGLEPCISPEILNGGFIPSFMASVQLTSTCDNERAGPSIRTRSIDPFGPAMTTVSSAANCPGWESSNFGVS